MPINGVGAGRTAPLPAQRLEPGSSRAMIAAAERYLNMRANSLHDALAAGKTMQQLAAERGLGTERLVRSMAAALSDAQPMLDDDRAWELASRMVNGDSRGGRTVTAGAAAASDPAARIALETSLVAIARAGGGAPVAPATRAEGVRGSRPAAVRGERDADGGEGRSVDEGGGAAEGSGETGSMPQVTAVVGRRGTFEDAGGDDRPDADPSVPSDSGAIPAATAEEAVHAEAVTQLVPGSRNPHARLAVGGRGGLTAEPAADSGHF